MVSGLTGAAMRETYEIVSFVVHWAISREADIMHATWA
jgi:hypothetical protein